MFKKLEIVEWMDDSGREIVHRVPQSGAGEFRLGSQVVVRESQDAVFFRDGKAMDVLGPGRHTITTENIPLLTGVVSTLFEGKDSPFRATVFYVNKKTFTDMKWGTKEPIIFRDKELSMVRLRAFGSFSMKVEQSQLFINKLVGTEGRFSTDEIEGFLKGMIISRLADLLGETLETIFDLAKYYDEIGTLAKSRLGDDFGKYGIQLVDFYVQAITPPEEVQQRIDERSAMGALGDMNQYMRFKTATAMGDAATNEGGGGAAGAGVGMGAGLGMGMTMANMMGQTMANGGQSGGQSGGGTVQCPSCGKNVPPGKFCPECGKPMGVQCSQCGNVAAPGTKFCPECGNKLGGGKKCAKCGADVPADSKFCPECGEKQE
ncbi:MAG: zinc-ribbon domain-containing protein [Candidatus Aegiribacteria sp.]|nr:zinc-ribbon domain-containing protein [Candidatus Aegiribacteria sp.]MBD3295733.1 zinc-ribbon domain-containing protein [Candidatus Fermentibacteria bacterium]